MNRKEKTKIQRLYTAELLGNRCKVCGKKFGKGSTFHHIIYHKTEKTYRDFKNQFDYQDYILPIINKRPEEFYILCTGHHLLVEKLKRFKPERFLVLVDIVVQSNKGDGGRY